MTGYSETLPKGTAMPPVVSEIVVEKFRIIEDGNGGRVECRIRSEGFPERLFFNLRPTPTDLCLVEEPNWALVALLYPAMATGRDLQLDAGISPLLLHAAQNDLQGILHASDPRLKRIRVSAAPSTATRQRAAGVATGFSAGVDSFATVSL